MAGTPWNKGLKGKQAMSAETRAKMSASHKKRWESRPGAKSYVAFHIRINRIRGKARNFNCIDCGDDAIEWSWVHDSDPLDVNNYEPRCRKCHVRYDGIHSRPEIIAKWRAKAIAQWACRMSGRDKITYAQRNGASK